MSRTDTGLDTAFQWNNAVSHLGYCIVKQGEKFRLFTPDGILLDERFNSLDEATLQASYYFLESTVQTLLDDWHESKVLEPTQYTSIVDSMISRKSDSLLMRASQLKTVSL